MLSINDNNDIIKMKKYHRTRDMINLLLYFPQVSPVRDLTIIEDVQDYLNNYDHCKKKPGHRVDSLISKPVINGIEIGSYEQDFVNLITQIKNIDPDSVFVFFGLKNDYSERYAGISIGISVGRGVYISAVGKDYDGREVSKRITTHEGYFIPWTDLNNCRIDNFKTFRNHRINYKEYKNSRIERIKFLLSVGYKKEIIENSVPHIYEDIPDFIWSDIIKNIIRKLPKMEEELLSAGFKDFAISGHTEGTKFMP